ncbi:MAG: protein-disulfide reductase DsbD family protein, partial [Gammaproteobacteria bacterium]|nr:protein-disulfide reductase DsbD family protein [Gammaproteobacteria bacterium]
MKRLIVPLLVAASLLNFGAVKAQEGELLPPEKAFALAAWMENNSLIAEFQIAPGYYMYRERFDFQVESANARFDTAIMPDGKIKNDKFFGDMEVYRDSVRIELPIIYESTKAAFLKVKTTGQGCADIGVCYPALNQSLDIDTRSTARIYPTAYQAPIEPQIDDNVQKLQALLGASNSSTEPATSSDFDITTDSSNALSVLQLLGEEQGLTDDEEIPHPDTAFKLSASLDGNGNVLSEIVIYPNTYLYRDKTKVNLVDGNDHRLGGLDLPKGKEKNDEFLGDTEVYYDLLSFSVPVISDA